MKVILNIGINGLGTEGEIVSVKDGYARNYLIPRGMAKNATKIPDIDINGTINE